MTGRELMAGAWRSLLAFCSGFVDILWARVGFVPLAVLVLAAALLASGVQACEAGAKRRRGVVDKIESDRATRANRPPRTTEQTAWWRQCVLHDPGKYTDWVERCDERSRLMYPSEVAAP